ncbi:MAG: hypothetical protein ABIQ06_12390 [Caldimonas sp.]
MIEASTLASPQAAMPTHPEREGSEECPEALPLQPAAVAFVLSDCTDVDKTSRLALGAKPLEVAEPGIGIASQRCMASIANPCIGSATTSSQNRVVRTRRNMGELYDLNSYLGS